MNLLLRFLVSSLVLVLILSLMGKSINHHYLPEFYLKGFTDENGMFMIYLLKKDVFKKNGKPFSPASHFFIPHDNTVTVDGIESDFIEQTYGRMETKVAKVFEKIKAVDSDYDLAETDVPLLQYFVAELFWRLPSHRSVIEHIAKTHTLKELGILIKDQNTGETIEDGKFEENVRNNPIYVKFLRTILPVNTYAKIFECTSPVTIFTFPKGLPAICSDNPLILRNPEKLDLYNDDFILPLTDNKILIRIKKLKPQFWSTVKIDIDMMLLAQAKEFVCCVEKTYPTRLKAIILKNNLSVESLRKRVFESIDADFPLER